MPNRLAAETSPYLRQHAENPVDWWPWSDEALAKAREQGKPILLSIGYSACHWCHVMAHESFEDAGSAAVMNELFICIKVDREERPDLDKIYQLAHQALTRRAGGWPLTVFLAPDDHLPFYAGTYFPKDARYGMPPFTRVLQQVRNAWDTRRDDLRSQNAALSEFLQNYDAGTANSDALTDSPIRLAIARIQQNFDPVHGGHSGAPKFPHCPEMELLLDLECLESNPDPHPSPRSTFSRWEKENKMVELTLRRMADGGIHDQIGGGFCRYSVDERWEIPHFEKMLYDNAQLLPLYASCVRGDSGQAFANIARDLIAWLLREMVSPDGAFYSALDADSEGEEGKFYVWQREEVRGALTQEEFDVVERHFGFDRPANFEGHAWNPIVAASLDSITQELQISVDDARSRLSSAREKLLTTRARRIRPGLDDKILTAWNALMIGGIARASRALDATPLIGMADSALDFLYTSAWRDHRLYAKGGDDAMRFPAYLDDHAFLLDALLECLQCRFSERDLAWAVAIAEALLQRFEDRERGGFFFTAHDHEKLIQRPKSWVDEAVPSGNGIAARSLLRLGHLLGETRYLDAAERTLRASWSTLQQMPGACPTLLRALNDFLNPRMHIIVRVTESERDKWASALREAAPIRSDVYFIPDNATDLSGTLAAQKYTSGGVAYVCRGTNCLPPIEHIEALQAALKE
jgi:uncharacterized protein